MKSYKKKNYVLKELFEAAIILLVIYIGFPIWLKAGKTKVHDKDGICVYVDKNTSEESINNIVRNAFDLLSKHNIQPEGQKLNFIFYPTREDYAKKNLFISRSSLAANWGVFRCITFAPVDMDSDRQFSRNEFLNQRPVSSVMAHEIVHTYQIHKLGPIKYITNNAMAKWKIEGQAEYVSESSSFPYAKGMEIFVGGDKEDFLKSNGLESEYFYFKSHLMADYLLSHMNISEDGFWKTNFDVDNLEAEIKEAIISGEYKGLFNE